MFGFTDLVSTLQFVVLVGFVGISAFLLVLTIVYRLRIKNIALVCYTGPLFGLPPGPTAFLIGVPVLVIVMAMNGTMVHPVMVGGYLVGGLFWFAAGFISSTLIVTENGVFRGISKDAIAWGQVVDYFQIPDKNHKKGVNYVFFYEDNDLVRRRFEVKLPPSYVEAFGEVLKRRLDRRFDFLAPRTRGTKKLEG